MFKYWVIGTISYCFIIYYLTEFFISDINILFKLSLFFFIVLINSIWLYLHLNKIIKENNTNIRRKNEN